MGANFNILDTALGDRTLNAAALAAINAAAQAPVTIAITSATPPSIHGQDVEITLSAATVAVLNVNEEPTGGVTISTKTATNKLVYPGQTVSGVNFTW